jgi:lipopolysaccharide transport system permease protein
MSLQIELNNRSLSDPASKPPAPEGLRVTAIRPAEGRVLLELGHVWEHRDLVFLLVWRDIKVRYKQTLLGVTWAVLNPIMTMVVFTVLFGRLARVPSQGVPYSVFTFSALVPWAYFVTALSQACNSVVWNQALIKSVYFPRLVLPVAALLPGLVDLVIALVVLIGLMLFHGIVPGVAAVALPLFVLMAVVTALGVGLWVSALNVQYRDIGFVVVPFMLQLWLFLTPVAYPSSLVPEPWRTLSGLNPMAGVVEGFRWALLGTGPAPGRMLVVSVIATLGVLIGGLYFFRGREDLFSDVV